MSALAMSDYILGTNAVPDGGERFVVWIDQVGAFLLCLKPEITIGGPAAEGAPADLSLLANLSRRHATIVRSGERYVLVAHAPTFVAGRPVHDRVDLADGNEIRLGGSVRLLFRLPSVMSGSARLEFVSDHRPARAVDGVILMAETCQIGAGLENHIRCPEWPGAVVLYRRDGALWCRSRDPLFIDGTHVPDGGALKSGCLVSGNEVRFRLEQIG
jgi:FHA domain